LIASTETGLYQQAETILHRLDPRVKVLSCLVLVVLSFGAAGWMQLLSVSTMIALAAWSIKPLSQRIFRFFWLLRWFFLFTFLLHLFLSPGRTLWGLSWLSFDGLLSGSFVCLQMLLAVAASALLGITTTTQSLALAFAWFVRPLRWVGCRTDEWQKILLLAMDFVPVVQEEIRASSQEEIRTADAVPHAASQGRFAAWGKRLHDLIFRLVARGDEIAHRLALDDAAALRPMVLPAFLPMALLDQLFSIAVCLVILSYWLVG
jgi:energy-coupling factor transport system permease protein